MNYGWTILIWVAIGLYVFSFLNKVDTKPKRKRKTKNVVVINRNATMHWGFPMSRPPAPRMRNF